MRRALAAAALLTSASPAFAADRSDVMKWEAAFQVLNAVDAATTIACMHQKDCEEANPLVGKHPSTAKIIGIKAAVGLIHFYAVNEISKRDTKTALRIAQVSVFAQGTVVGLNLRVIW